jgi:hypothetical protein
MKLSVEAKVAAAVAAGFLAVTVGGLVALDGGVVEPAGPNDFAAKSEPGVHKYFHRQEYDARGKKSDDHDELN